MVSLANQLARGISRWWWIHPISLSFCIIFNGISIQADPDWESRSANWNQQPSYIYSPETQPTPAPGHYITSSPLNIQQQQHQQLPVQTSIGTYELRSFCRSARGQFPSGNGCNKFVNCWDGDVVEQDCPTGLLFTSKGYCDYAWNVQCEGRALPPASELAAGIPPGWNPYQEQAVCPDGDGVLTRSINDCGSFVVCHHGVFEKIACPAGLHFNQEVKVCDFPENVRCGYSSGYNTQDNYSPSSNVPPPQPPRPIIPQYPQRPTDDFISQPIYNQYTNIPNKPVIETHHVTRLPAGLVAGAASSSCREGATFPLTLGSCQHVSLCRNGRATLVHCPEEQGFDSYSSRCLPAERARC